jgi:pSer/pThr/pTyr-binding forkhead associated (FHA) protein
MRDGRTRKQEGRREGGLDSFLERHEATLVVVRGAAPGKEHDLDGPKLVIGRGPDVDLPFEDEEMSSHHAAIEWSGSGFRVCDLGSTNGTFVNGARVQARDLAHGDRLQLGRHLLQLRLEARRSQPKVYAIQDD